jgi:CTP:molybdopterin cytidylyltransferase MocA
MSRAAAVILAAGRGQRLGGVAKALLEIDGETFLARIAGRCAMAGVAPTAVVVGAPHAAAVTAEAERLGLAAVVNPQPERGMGSSIALGFAHAGATFVAPVALLWPVDHPRVSAASLEALLSAATADRVVIPEHAGRGGHPVAVGRDLWAALVAGAGSKGGARAVFRHNRDRVLRVPVTDPGVVRDVDLPRDLP